jgi:hypothetical protein
MSHYGHLTGPLLIPQVVHEYEEPGWNDIDRRKPKNLEKNLSQCHFVDQNFHID